MFGARQTARTLAKADSKDSVGLVLILLVFVPLISLGICPFVLHFLADFTKGEKGPGSDDERPLVSKQKSKHKRKKNKKEKKENV